MKDSSETLIAAISGIIGLEFLTGWIGILIGLTTIIFLITRIIQVIRREKKERGREKREKEKHQLETKLLKQELEEKKKGRS